MHIFQLPLSCNRAGNTLWGAGRGNAIEVYDTDGCAPCRVNRHRSAMHRFARFSPFVTVLSRFISVTIFGSDWIRLSIILPLCFARTSLFSFLAQIYFRMLNNAVQKPAVKKLPGKKIVDELLPACHLFSRARVIHSVWQLSTICRFERLCVDVDNEVRRMPAKHRWSTDKCQGGCCLNW